MRYTEVSEAMFVERVNRFVARVRKENEEILVHVKNTGRLQELLIPGNRVYLSHAKDPKRRTAYDLVSVRMRDGRLFNVDAQAPNQVISEWLPAQGFSKIHPEYRFGASRLDFCAVRNEDTWLMEVKGCTLVKDDIGFFPDAPTTRGTRHMQELVKAVQAGYWAAVLFVIQTENVWAVKANAEHDPAFAKALTEAQAAGVQVIPVPCLVTEDSLCVHPDSVFPLS